MQGQEILGCRTPYDWSDPPNPHRQSDVEGMHHRFSELERSVPDVNNCMLGILSSRNVDRVPLGKSKFMYKSMGFDESMSRFNRVLQGQEIVSSKTSAYDGVDDGGNPVSGFFDTNSWNMRAMPRSFNATAMQQPYYLNSNQPSFSNSNVGNGVQTVLMSDFSERQKDFSDAKTCCRLFGFPLNITAPLGNKQDLSASSANVLKIDTNQVKPMGRNCTKVVFLSL